MERSTLNALISSIFATVISANAVASSDVLPANTYLIYSDKVDFDVPGGAQIDESEFYRRLISYVDESGSSEDIFMDAFVFIPSINYINEQGDFGSCDTVANCSVPAALTNYQTSLFSTNGHLDKLREAEVDVSVDIPNEFSDKLDSIKIYFTLPAPKEGAIVSSTNEINPIYRNELMTFVSDLKTGFDNWKSNNPTSTIELAGFYMGKESLRVGSSNTMLSGGTTSVNPDEFLPQIRGEIKTLGQNLQLVASPYQNFYGNGSTLDLATSFEGREFKIFNASAPIDEVIYDVSWLQANHFYRGFKFGSPVDREMIRWLTSYYQNYPYVGFNMETRWCLDQSIDEVVPELVNYADYSRAYGLNHFSTIYYDDGEGLVKYSLNYDASVDDENAENDYCRPTKYWWYEEGYQMAKRNRDGYIANGGFEYFELVKPSRDVSTTELSDYNAGKVVNWDGTGDIVSNDSSSTADFVWSTSGSQRPSIGTFRLEEKAHRITMHAQKDVNDGQSYPGIVIWRFLDENGNQITTGTIGGSAIKYSSFVNGWYQYLTPSTSGTSINITFTPPPGTVDTEILLGKWSGTSTITWSNVALVERDTESLVTLIGKNSLGNFTEHNFQDMTQFVALDAGEYFEQDQAFPITGGLQHRIRFESQLDDESSCSSYHGLVGVQLLDDGTIFTGSVSNLTYSSFLNMHFRYFDSTTAVEEQTLSFTSPSSINKARVYVRNWSCSSELKVDNIAIEEVGLEATNPINAMEPVGLDQSGLIRLNTNNKRSRFVFDASTESGLMNLVTKMRANCPLMSDQSCSGKFDLVITKVDSQGSVLSTQQHSAGEIAGFGEFTPVSGETLLIFSHWERVDFEDIDVTNVDKVYLDYRFRDDSTAKEVLISRPTFQ